MLNRCDELSMLMRYALDIERDHDAKVAVARRTREAIIKVAPVGGLPKVRLLEFSSLWQLHILYIGT